MMLPPPWRFITSATHWLIRSGPSRLTAKILRHSSSVISLVFDRDGLIPALLTRHVDPTERPFDLGDERRDRLPLADMAGERQDGRTGLRLDLLRHRLAQILFAAADDDRRPGGGEPGRHRPTDPLGRAGDDRHLAAEIEQFTR